MFNKEFLKTLTVLYVEDDDTVRSSLSNLLEKVFLNIIICKDGEEGLNQFKSLTQEQRTKIDVVVSDINMPIKNGIELAQEIRALDADIPIIFTTAHAKAKDLMEAIHLKISYYALKPINTTELLDNISKFCMIEHNKNVILEKSAQITKYISIIDNIASIFKVDTSGNIIEVNDLMCEISEYTQEELLSMHLDTILNKETSSIKTFQDTLSLIDNNDLFKTKLKCISKSGGTFYLNSTIIISKNEYSEEIEEYIYICIDQTEDELEKQQTMQRVRKNMILQRTKESELLKITKELEKEIENIKASSISSTDTKVILATLAKEKQKVSYLNSQITHYEQEIVKLKKKQEKIDIDDKAKKLEVMRKQENYLNEKEKFQSKIIELQSLLSQQEAKHKAKEIF
ncbi:hypothetical protein ALC152_07250 [Arcobacter sp. 15-2]|uniref:response regulator n=1 Tax=Arcobacter sp. 15-2 TaxID=3374109 RepID=UPI00399CB5EF